MLVLLFLFLLRLRSFLLRSSRERRGRVVLLVFVKLFVELLCEKLLLLLFFCLIVFYFNCCCGVLVL